MTRPLALIALATLLAACADDGEAPNADPWNLDDVEAPVFVDAAAAPGGDGTLTRPYVSLAEGLVAVAGGGELVVAEGRYAMPGRVTLADTVRIRGAGAGLTVLAAGVEVGIEAGSLRLNDLDLELDAVVDADALRMASVDVLADAKLTLRAVSSLEIEVGRFEDADTLTIEGGASVVLRDTVWAGGRGARIRDVAQLAADGLSFADIGGVALWIERTDGTLTSSAVQDVWARADEYPLDGVCIQIDRGSKQLDRVSAVRCERRGMAFANGEASLTDVTIAGGGLTGLSVQIGAVVSAERLNAVDTNTLVFVNGAQATLDAPRLELARSTGILASDGAALVVRDAFMSECPDGHISVLGEGTSLTLLDSVLQDTTTASCVQIADTRAAQRIENNTIVRCAGAGVGVLEADDVSLLGNEIAGVRPDPLLPELADGVQLVDARVILRGNHIHDNDGAGVSGARSTGTLEGNRILDCGDAGIRLVDPFVGQDVDSPSIVADNVIQRTRGVGVFAFTTFAEVRSNRIVDVQWVPADGLGEGVLFGTGGFVSVVDNDIQGSGGNGVLFVDGAVGQVVGNFVSGSGMAGIRELCADGLADNDVVVGDNVIEASTTADIELCP